LVGSLAAEGATQPSFEQIKQAIVKGSILASFTCENFSTKSLEMAKNEDFDARFAKFQEISAW